MLRYMSCLFFMATTQVSLTRRHSHAVLKDVDYNVSLREQCERGELRYDGAAITFQRALRDLQKAI